MSKDFLSDTFWPSIAALCLGLASACSTLQAPVAAQSDYALEPTPPAPAKKAPSLAALTLIVGIPQASPGFDSRRMVYRHDSDKLSHYSDAQWIDTPARMLAPLIVAALAREGSFHAVVAAPSAAAGDLRLDTQILRLQQNFGSRPNHVQFGLLAYVIDNHSRRVLAWREFEATATAPSEDASGGATAANAAVAAVVEQLVQFCNESAGTRPAPSAPPGRQ